MYRSLIALFRNRDILLLITGVFLSNVGGWAQRLAIGWLVFELTQSATWVGIVAASEVLPAVLVAPFGGALVDRGNKMRILWVGHALALLQAALLAALAFAGWLDIWLLTGCTILLGLLEGINQPIKMTIVSDLAPSELIRPAISLNSMVNNSARFIGPSLGGFVLAYGSTAAAFALNAVTFIPLIVLGLRNVVSGARRVPVHAENLMSSVPQGIRYIVSHRLFSVLMLMAIVFGLCCRSIIELVPAISGRWFNGDATVLANLATSIGVGAVTAGLWMLGRTDTDRLLIVVLALPVGMVAGGAGLALFGHIPILNYVLMAGFGFFLVAINIGIQSLIHLRVSPLFKGRVLAVYGLILRVPTAVGAMIIGGAADYVGLRYPLLAGALIAAIVWALGWRAREKLMARTD